MADVLEVTDQSFQSEVLGSDQPVILDFWAEWCAPCRQLAPIIKELAAEYGDRIRIAKMDIDAHPQAPSQFGVRSIPTVLAFKDGRVVEQIVGLKSKAEFEAMAKSLLE